MQKCSKPAVLLTPTRIKQLEFGLNVRGSRHGISLLGEFMIKDISLALRKGSGLGYALNISSPILWILCFPLINQMLFKDSFLILLNVHKTISIHGGMVNTKSKLLCLFSLYIRFQSFIECRLAFFESCIFGENMCEQHIANNFRKFVESVGSVS